MSVISNFVRNNTLVTVAVSLVAVAAVASSLTLAMYEPKTAAVKGATAVGQPTATPALNPTPADTAPTDGSEANSETTDSQPVATSPASNRVSVQSPAAKPATAAQPPATSVPESPATNPEAKPGFTLEAQPMDQLSTRQAEHLGQLMHISAASIEIDFEEGYEAADKELTVTASAQNGDSLGHVCEISQDKGVILYVSIPEDNAEGDYTCLVTVSDGTVSRSLAYTVEHTALATENPQPASGYDFTFNVEPILSFEGYNVYTSNYNFPASPYCGGSAYDPCVTIANIAFNVSAAEGLTIPAVNETVSSPDLSGFSCNVFMTPSNAQHGYGIITLNARTDLEDGLYFCDFQLIEGDLQSSGTLVAELVDGKFQSVTAERLGELVAPELL